MIPGLRTLSKLVLLAAMAAAALTAAPVLFLSPSGALTGAPGATVGWGFTLTNNVNWIEVAQAQFCLDASVHNPCFNASAQFFDIISNPPQDVIVGPAGTVTQAYDPVHNLGLGSFHINGGASNGSSVSGYILLTYNTFDADPNNGGNQIGFNDAISATASVTAVTSGPSVPEPASLALVGLALAGLGTLRLRRRG